MGASINGPVAFNMPLPKRVDQDRQNDYESVCDNNRDLLLMLEKAILGYVHAGDCDGLRLLLKATSFLYASAEQIIIDQDSCLTCQDVHCSAAGARG